MFAYFVAFTCIGVVIGDQIVTINQGRLNGTVLRSRDDKPFYAFYGIPYAAAPIGKLRFSAPKKPPSWAGIRDASKKAPICLQATSYSSTNSSIIGQEDCLYLSVFTPQIKPDKPLPVMVYIHGGAFHVGSGDSSGVHFFMDKPMVLVTMNYRLGILGLLSAANAIIPGNYALKDQSAALRWVQSNIAHFGGNPKSVTIQGQSAGSACVHLHTMSPRSKGLFHRAIMESGSALSYWSHYDARDARRSFAGVVKRANCVYNTTTVEVLSCLRNIPAQQFVSIERSTLIDERISIKFRPVIEWPKIRNSFLTIPPEKLPYQNTSIPWIIGFNSAESLRDTISLLKKVGYNEKDITRQIRAMLFSYSKYAKKREQLSNATATLMRFYFRNETISKNNQQQICNLFSDFVYAMPLLHAAHNYPGPKYLYYYDHQNKPSSDLSPNTTTTFDLKGSSHSEELLSLFFNENKDKLNDADVKHSRKMIAYWTNFVINGTPNSQIDHLPHWDLFKPDTSNYLYIGNDKITQQKQLLSERYALWKSLLA